MPYDKPLPTSIDAERAVLGSVFLNRDALIAVAPWLKAADFYHQHNAWVYEAMLYCYAQRTPPDVHTISDVLRRNDRLDAIGGISFLLSLDDAVVSSYHVEYYGRIVQRTAVLRRLISAGSTIARIGYDDTPKELGVTIADAYKALNDATQYQTSTGLEPIGDVINRLYANFTSDQPDGISTTFSDLDSLIGGFFPSDFVVLAARPSVGKSALAGTLALQLAQSGYRVNIMSLEMSSEQYTMRLVAQESGIPLSYLRDNKLSSDQMVVMLESMARISDLPIAIDETGRTSIDELRARVLKNAATVAAPNVVIVDYMQLCRVPGMTDEYQVVTEVSKSLKSLAKEARCTVIGLSQLSRGLESRANKVPMLSDLRSSGQIEQDADVVMFIHREEMYDKETDRRGIADLHIAKARNGRLGLVPLRFEGATTSFKPLSYRTMEGYE